MSKRNYNVFFNTHTVSGIVISIGLFIIFFGGAFSLFKDEIKIWQEGKPKNTSSIKAINIDKILANFDKNYELYGRDIELTLNHNFSEIQTLLYPSKDSINASKKGKELQFFYTNPNLNIKKSYPEHYDLGEFLFRLHFLDQIPRPIGIFLAGIIALFFVFAIATGVIIHWKKIIPNFYKFDPKVTLKRIWADAHTTLGVIGLPFQFIYGITGAFFTLTTLVLIPANLFYKGNQEHLAKELTPDQKIYNWTNASTQKNISFNSLINQYDNYWNDFKISKISIKNYSGENMKLIINGQIPTDQHFVGTGRLVINPFNNTIEESKNPTSSNYIENTKLVLTRLHYANYGGIITKLIYFILAIITCFVIITGVLIWIESRNKKAMLLSERLYTAKVGHIYLAICLTMLPVTALAFSFVRITEGMFTNKKLAIYVFYFLTWLGFTLFFRFKRNNYLTNKYNLLLASIFGFLIPIVNGITTNNWFWDSYKNQSEIFIIDLFWILIAGTCLIFYVKLKPSIKSTSTFTKLPINYNTVKEDLLLERSNTIITNTEENETDIPMKTKIIILWIFLGLGWIVHHIYGLFQVYYVKSVMMEGATGEAPIDHHMYRIVFEGLCLLFGLLSIELSKKWFVWTSFIFAIVSGVYNLYHLVTSFIYEASNISEIFMLILMVVASAFLIKNLDTLRKTTF